MTLFRPRVSVAKVSLIPHDESILLRDVSPRLERVLGSTNMLPSTKLFVDGDYRFPSGIYRGSGYHFQLGVIAADGTKSSGGGGGNRRNVTLRLEVPPSKPKLNPAGSPRATWP
jgi:hypothetical protein